MKKEWFTCHVWIIIVLILLAHNPGLFQESRQVQGELIGCIYESDGITPVKQATVQIKRLPKGEVFTSSLSDRDGMFRVRGIEKGVYLIGVKTSNGNFNGQNLLGILISADVSARVEITLSFEKKTADALMFVPLLPNPVGQVSIVAGNQAIFDGIVKINDKPREAGPFKIRYPQ